jgi:hypothetical protein
VEQCDQQNGSESHQNKILKDVGEGHQGRLLLKDSVDGGQGLRRAIAERHALEGEISPHAAQILEQEEVV